MATLEEKIAFQTAKAAHHLRAALSPKALAELEASERDEALISKRMGAVAHANEPRAAALEAQIMALRGERVVR